MNVRRWFLVVVVALIGLSPAAEAQQSSIGVPVPALGDGPWVFDTAEQHKINVSVVTKQLEHPWAIAFLPNGDMLVTERPGRLRIVRRKLRPQWSCCLWARRQSLHVHWRQSGNRVTGHDELTR